MNSPERNYLVAEKGGNRVAYRLGPGSYCLEVCAKGFDDRVFYAPESECRELIEFLTKRLPKFQFELCNKEDFTIEEVIGGVTYIFRK